jgi:putative Mn2+ efflux pump MntP
MSLIQIIAIALGLAMDAFAVSISSGLSLVKERKRYFLQVALFFGFFQGIMPVIGWSLGTAIGKYLATFSKIVACGILVMVGLKMLYEAMKAEDQNKIDYRKSISIFFLAIATSIDALAAGFSLALLHVSIIEASIVIGFVTFVLSLLGTYIGSKLGHFFENKIEIVGGIILILIGLKSLII